MLALIIFVASNNSEKNPCVRKIVCLQFWGRKWRRQFYGRLEKCVLSAAKTHAHKSPLLEGGYLGFWGGEVPIVFLWARGFLWNSKKLEYGCNLGAKKHINRIFLGLSRDFWGDFVYVFFSPPQGMTWKKHINKCLAPTQSRDNPANLFMFMCFSFPEK